MRRGLKSPSRPETRKIVSTLAATTCSSVRWPALLRENLDLRGRMAWIIARPSPLGGRILEGEAEIDAGRRGGLDLGEDVVAVEGDDGRAGAGLDVRPDREPELQQRVVERPQSGLAAGEHGVHVFDGAAEVVIRVTGLLHGAERGLGDPLGGVGPQAVLGL